MFLAAALLLRLLLPAVPEFTWHPAVAVGQALAVSSATPLVTDERDMAVAGEAATLDTEPSASSFSWHGVLALVWALGVLVVGVWLVASHWLIRRWVLRHGRTPDAPIARLFRWSCGRMDLQRRVGLVEMPRIATAAVCGWLRPIVIVPVGLRDRHSDDEIRGILLHELAHVRRCDGLWSRLGLSACALHWFNPLAWLTLRRFHSDRELDCDRMALAKLTVPQRDAYAPALYKTLTCPAFTAPAALVPFFRHQHEIHTRILTIMKPHQSLLASLAALLIIPAFSILTLTTAGADEEKPTGKPAAPETPAADKPRDGEREGEGTRRGPRDGEMKKEGPRDGETPRTGARDGEGARKSGERDGEGTRKSAEGDGARKTGPRDGDTLRTGARDGEGTRKTGPRDGEGTRQNAARDGEGMKRGARDGESSKNETAGSGKTIVLRVTGNGESVTVNGETVPTNRLRGYLSEHLPANRDAAVFIEAEDDVPHKAVMEVLDAAKDNGAKKASIRAIAR
jgi:beta-lactamase regulating signal transducer with metallopeptidase domain